jgi:hypothetical protein
VEKILVSMMVFVLATIMPVHKKLSANAQMESQSSTPSGRTAGINIDEEKQRAVTAVKAFAGDLKAELKKALKEGGATNAITVCNTRANQIARDVSRARNLAIKRVSLRNRNPNNAPNQWQKAVLEEFESRKLKGEPVSELTFTQVVENGTARQFRFMKAIPTGPICITCHGTQISSEVKKRLDQLYPDDKARGFRPGDIRGAFVVTSDMSR